MSRRCAEHFLFTGWLTGAFDILLREKKSKSLCLQEEQKGEHIIPFIFLSTNSKSVLLQTSTL